VMGNIVINVLTSGETAALLSRTLGPVRNWTFFLADCNRGRTRFYGLTLEPVGQLHDGCDRPVYRKADVAAFIRAALPFAAPARAGIAVEIDPAAYLLPWRMRRLKHVGEGTS
jgi:hypothetical protein